MQAICLGRVTVATAGVPVLFSSLLTPAQLAMLPPSQQVAQMDIWPDPAAVGKVYVKCQVPGQSLTTLAVLPVPAGGYPVPWSTCGDTSRNVVAFKQYSLDAATSGDGAYVTLWVA
jgi:hypothetical protein